MSRNNVRGSILFQWFTIEPNEYGRIDLIGWGEFTRSSVLAGQQAGPVRTFPQFDTEEQAREYVAEEFKGLEVASRPTGDAAAVRWMMGSGAPDTYLGDDWDY